MHWAYTLNVSNLRDTDRSIEPMLTAVMAEDWTDTTSSTMSHQIKM